MVLVVVVAIVAAVMVVDMFFNGAMDRGAPPTAVTRSVVKAFVVVPTVMVPPMSLLGIIAVMGAFFKMRAMAVITAGPGAS